MWRKQLCAGVFLMTLIVLIGLTTPIVTAQTPTATSSPTVTATPPISYVHSATVIERGNLRAGPGTTFEDVGDVEIGDTVLFMDDPENPGKPIIKTDNNNREWARLVTAEASEVWVWVDLIGGKSTIISTPEWIGLGQGQAAGVVEEPGASEVELDSATLEEINAALDLYNEAGIGTVEQYNDDLIVIETESFHARFPDLPANVLLSSERVMDDFKSGIIRQVANKLTGETPSYEEVDAEINTNGENSEYLRRFGDTQLSVRSFNEFVRNENAGPSRTISLREVYDQEIIFLRVAIDHFPGGDNKTPNGALTVTESGRIVFISFTPRPDNSGSLPGGKSGITRGMWDEFNTMLSVTLTGLTVNGVNLYPPLEGGAIESDEIQFQLYLLNGAPGTPPEDDFYN